MSNNRAGTEGGGVFSQADTVMLDSTVSGNAASGGGIGDGGGGVANYLSLAMRNDTVAGNRANKNGGGILSSQTATAKLDDVTVARNRAGANNSGSWSGGGSTTAPARS